MGAERSGPQVRAAVPADAPAILALLHAAYEEYRGRLDPPSGAHAETPASVERLLSAGQIIVAEADGSIVGLVACEARGEALYFGRLSVAPARRRHGIGAALIAAVEARARALGLARVELGVRLALPRQRAYYAGLGYREVGLGTHAGYPAPTYAIMVKEMA